MHQHSLLQTIQSQQSQIQRLKDQLNRTMHSPPPLLHNPPPHLQTNPSPGPQNINFQQKYMKALKQISTILHANKQFKQELMNLREERQYENSVNQRIKKQEFQKAYENWRKEKNQLLSQKQKLELENQKMKYAVAELEESISKIKNQKIALAQEKQSLRIMSPSSNKDRSDRDADIKRNMDNYQEHHATLSKTIAKLEESNRTLENKIYDLQSDFTNRLNQQQIQARQSKLRLKDEYENQINDLRKDLSRYKVSNNELTIKVKSFAEEQKVVEGQNQYQKQLIQTLREVKAQMEPMRSHIAELQEKNQFQRQQTQRQKASLQIKVIEMQSQIERLREVQKLMEGKEVRQSDKNRKLEEAERVIKKLQEENRMIGGRLIVLESKQVALRNRNGDQLEERVLEFQNRVQMLLSDKETIANMKNIGIHQLIALKAYILELDAKLKQVVNENEYAVKKYKSYKQKCTHLIKQLKQHDIAINALKGKLQGYDRLVVKLQGQFERAISINDSQIKTLNMKITQQSAISIEVYKKRYESLVEKLSLQQKYSEQELQTLKLNYETQIVELQIKLEELNSIKETIGLYKSKNQELSIKLTEKQNQLLESKINRSPLVDIPQSKVPSKETIQKLNQTINSKETTIINLQNQIRKIETEWRSKYNQLQQMSSTSLSKKANLEQEKQNQIDRLEQEIKNYRKKINDLEATVFKFENSNNEPKGDIQYKQYQSIANKKSELQIDLEQLRSKYESEMNKTNKLSKQLSDCKKSNQDLEGELSRLRFEIQNVEKQLQMQITEKNNEIRRLKSRNENDATSPKPDVSEAFKISSLKMQLETMQTQQQYLQKQKQRYYNKAIQLERNILQINDQLQRTKMQLTRLKNNSNEQLLTFNHERELDNEKLQYTIKMLKQKTKTLQSNQEELQQENRRLKQEVNKQRQRMISEINYKEEQYNKITREFNKLRNQFNAYQDNNMNSNHELQFKVARYVSEINGYKDEIESNIQRIQRYENQIKKYREREYEYEEKISALEIKIQSMQRSGQSDKNNYQDQIHDLQNKIMKLQQDFKFYQDNQTQNEEAFAKRENYIKQLSQKINAFEQRESELDNQLYAKSGEISKLNSELLMVKNQFQIYQQSAQKKDSQLSRLNSELIQLKNKVIEWEFEVDGKNSSISRLNSEISYLKNQLQNLEIELEETRRDSNKWKYQHNWNQEQSSNIKLELQEKQLALMRLQNDLKSKSEYINEISEQIQSKNIRISELQSQNMRLRASSTDYQSEMMDKNSQISRLNYELSSLKNRYNQLEQSFDQRENEHQGMSRQILEIRSNLEQYQQQINIKQSMVERYKKDVKQLNEQIQNLNNEIFNKSKEINRLNQQIFRIKMESDQNASTGLYKLESQIHQLKLKVTTLEDQLQRKQFQLSKAEIQARNYRTNVQVNKYSDEQYDLLQAQYYQLQSSLNAKNREISQYQLQIQQLKSKIDFQSKMQRDLKKQYEEDHQYLQNQIQTVMARERKLKVQLQAMQNDMMYQTTSKDDYEKQQFGMNLYQNQVDRLNSIVEDLTDQINGLKLKMTNMTNQEDRIVENLTVMTLTFAEVEALRLRMKSKENQISEVRKSLIQYASSNQDISINSKKILQFNSTSKFDSHENVDSRQEYRTNYKKDQVNRDTMHETRYPSENIINNQQTQQLYQTNDSYQNQNRRQSDQNFEGSNEQQSGNMLGARTVNSYGDGFMTGTLTNQQQIVEVREENIQTSEIIQSQSENSKRFNELVEEHKEDEQQQNSAINQGYQLNNNANQSSSSFQRSGQINISYGGSPNPSPESSINPGAFHATIPGPSPSGSFHIQGNQAIKMPSPVGPYPHPGQMNMINAPHQRPIPQGNQPQINFQGQNRQHGQGQIIGGRPAVSFGPGIPQQQQGFFIR